MVISNLVKHFSIPKSMLVGFYSDCCNEICILSNTCRGDHKNDCELLSFEVLII